MTVKTRNARYTAAYWQEDNVNTTGLPTKQSVSKTHTLSRTRTGVSVPNWLLKIRSHASATSALSGTYDTMDSTGLADFTFRYRGYTPSMPSECIEKVTGDIPAYNLWTPTMAFNWPSDADARALQKFLGNVRKLQTEVSSLTFLGELRPTLAMLRMPAKGIWDLCWDYYRALKKRKRMNPNKWLDYAPGLWLEYSFGWKPLMMDIADAFSALNNLLKGDRVTVVKGAKSSSKLTYDTIDSYSPGQGFYTPHLWYVRRSWTLEDEYVRYRGAVRTRAATTFKDAAARWGFTPSDFVPTLWELLPWSFLVDYFVTIGDALDAYYADQRTLVWVCKTVRRRGRNIVSLIPNIQLTESKVPLGKVINTSGSSGSAVWERRTILRSDQTGTVLAPSVSLIYNGPKWGQYANISALFGQFCSNLHTQNMERVNWRR